MSKSEFRYNKKRKHYSYIFKQKGILRKNLLLHSDPLLKNNISKDKLVSFLKNNTPLCRHPNPNIPLHKKFYIENRIYVDHYKSFDKRIYKWIWDKNDKRKIKRIKKGRRTR